MIINIEKVKDFIRSYGNMTELAEYSGVDRTMLYKILSGERQPGLKTLEGLMRAGLKWETIM